jgi:hypothetical protein
VVHVIHVGDFYPEVVNYEAENDTAPDVTPESWRVLALVVSLFGESLLEELVGDDAGLGEAIHPFSNFDIDPSFVIDQVAEVVFDGDFFGDDVESEAHVFRFGHRSVEVEVGEVNAEEHGSRGADGGVDEEFGSEEIRSRSALIAGKVNEVTANSESSAVDLLLLRANVAYNATVGGALVLRDL